MKNIRGFVFGLALGLAAAVTTVGIAQNPAPADSNKTAQSCCASHSSGGDSCQMKHDAKEHATKTHATHEGCCCCCSGDSCSMKHEQKKEG